MVQLIAWNIWEEFCQLIIHFCSCRVILNVKIRVTKQWQSCSVPWRELKLISKNCNHLKPFLAMKDKNIGEKDVWAAFQSQKSIFMENHRSICYDSNWSSLSAQKITRCSQNTNFKKFAFQKYTALFFFNKSLPLHTSSLLAVSK